MNSQFHESIVAIKDLLKNSEFSIVDGSTTEYEFGWVVRSFKMLEIFHGPY